MKILSILVGTSFRQPKFAIDFPNFGFEVLETRETSVSNMCILEINSGAPNYNNNFSEEIKKQISDAGYSTID